MPHTPIVSFVSIINGSEATVQVDHNCEAVCIKRGEWEVAELSFKEIRFLLKSWGEFLAMRLQKKDDDEPDVELKNEKETS